MPQSCTAGQVKAAMGNTIGDSLTISNQWASVLISKTGPKHFELLAGPGDGDGSCHPNAYRALGAALDILAEYEQGRVG